MRKKAVQSKPLQHSVDSKENATNVEESGTRPPIVDQEELAGRDAMIIMIMRVKEMVAGRIETPITSIYTRSTVVFIVKRKDISPNTVGQNNKKKLERMGWKQPIWL